VALQVSRSFGSLSRTRTGKLQAMKIFKSDVDTVDTHQECGISFEDFDDIQEVRIFFSGVAPAQRHAAQEAERFLFLIASCSSSSHCLHRLTQGDEVVCVEERMVKPTSL
jgi:hypothetical protein